ELVALQQNLYEVSRRKSSLLAISPQTPDKARAAARQHGLTFDLLHDAGSRVAKSFGLAFEVHDSCRQVLGLSGVDLGEYNGDSGYELPVPATYVVDGEGVIRYAFADPDYTRRAEPIEIIGVLRSLRD
ncbi:MAG: redoxin domain-containing protein, partial [Acidobacteriota bacterium]